MVTETTFFSYSRNDAEFALKLASDLKKYDSTVWVDQIDLRGGKLWDNEIEHQLKKCTRVLVILSPHSVVSSNVLDEISYALYQKKEIIPVMLKECAIPLRLQRLHYINFCNNYDQALKTLLSTLNETRDSKFNIDGSTTTGYNIAGQTFRTPKWITFFGIIATLVIALLFLWWFNNNSVKTSLIEIPDNVSVSEDSLKFYKDYGILEKLIDNYGDTFDYKGGVLDNLPEGYGIAKYVKGDSYAGKYKKGLFSGKGKYIYANGDAYVGDFKNDSANGFGSMEYTNGYKYIGYWINELENGKGSLFYPNGCVYKGNFVNGLIQGYGELTDPSGNQILYLKGCYVFKGNWSNNKKNGTGTCFDAKGNILYSGLFINDKPTQKYPLNK